MPLFRSSVLAIPSSTDNALMRWDGTTGTLTQDANETLTDGGILTLPDSTTQVIIGQTATTITFATISLAPHLLINQAGPTNPVMGLLRDGTTDSAAPTFNYFRSNAGGAVKTGNLLGIFTGNGHDGTDYAAGGQIDFTVDESSDTGSGVAANKMGTRCRFLTSPDGTQSPTLKSFVPKAGCFQLVSQTLITIAASPAAPPAGLIEYDGKVMYFDPEAINRGVVPAIYIIAPTGANTMTNDTSEQALFDDVGGGVLTIPTGTYRFSCLLTFSGLSVTVGNMYFDILGAGTATIASARYMTNGIDNVINTANANSGSMSNAAQSAQPIILGANSAELQLHITGIFRISVAGTIIPSCSFANNPSAASRAANSFFECFSVGSDTVQTVGRWS